MLGVHEFSLLLRRDTDKEGSEDHSCCFGFLMLLVAPLSAFLVSPGAASSSRVVPMVALEEIPTQFEEEVVLEAMGITNLGRAAVMNMLRDVGGSLEALVDHLFL